VIAVHSDTWSLFFYISYFAFCRSFVKRIYDNYDQLIPSARKQNLTAFELYFLTMTTATQQSANSHRLQHVFAFCNRVTWPWPLTIIYRLHSVYRYASSIARLMIVVNPTTWMGGDRHCREHLLEGMISVEFGGTRVSPHKLRRLRRYAPSYKERVTSSHRVQLNRFLKIILTMFFLLNQLKLCCLIEENSRRKACAYHWKK